MAYEKQNFLDGQIVTAGHLNHIENGIVAAQNPRNLLDNSDFRNPVNQRGASSYFGSRYTIDRWRSWETGFNITVGDNGIAVSGGSLVQYIEKRLSGIYTVAAMTSSGTLYLLTANMNDAMKYEGNLGMGSPSEGPQAVSIGVGTYIWAALYEGAYTADTLPPYVPKGYGAELTECRRYYRRNEFLNCVKTNGNFFSVSASIEMRVKPTVEFLSFSPYGASSVTDFSDCSISIAQTADGVQRFTYATLPTCTAHRAGGLAVHLNADL